MESDAFEPDHPGEIGGSASPEAGSPTETESTPATAAAGAAAPDAGTAPAAEPALDLDAISADLDGVEAALTRLGDGTYWTDEVTGEALPDDLLAASPTARRA